MPLAPSELLLAFGDSVESETYLYIIYHSKILYVYASIAHIETNCWDINISSEENPTPRNFLEFTEIPKPFIL